MWITFVAKIAETLENKGKNLKDILIENYFLVKFINGKITGFIPACDVTVEIKLLT